MKEKQITVLIKEPGEKPRLDRVFANYPEAFFEAVGGPCGLIRFTEDIDILYNLNPKKRELEYNCEIDGKEFYGTVVFVGVKKGDFCSLKIDTVSSLLNVLRDLSWELD